MKSFAVTLSRFLPRITTFTDSGTFTRTSLVNQELKTSVVPMPKATQPMAPDVRRVRVGADVQLAGQGIGLRHQRVADAFRAFAVFQLAMKANAALGEFFLLQLELASRDRAVPSCASLPTSLRRETSGDRGKTGWCRDR